MDAKIKTYSKLNKTRKPVSETLWDRMRKKEREERSRLDPLKYMKRLDSDDEKDNSDIDEYDEIIASPMRKRKFPTLQSKKLLQTTSSSVSNISQKKEIKISDDEDSNVDNGDEDDDDDDVLIKKSPSSKNDYPIKSSQSQSSSKKVHTLESLSIDSESRRTLDYGRMLNDTIVHFYMNYLMNKEPKTKTERIHLFNSFFFSKFKSLYRQQTNDGDRRKSTSTVKQIVARWDKHVSIFNKDFLVIPVCDQHHWFLLVIAFAYNLPADGDEPYVLKETSRDESKTHNQPAILIFDSMSHRYLNKLTAPIRDIFLRYRWSLERPDELPRDFNDRTLMPDSYATVPKQRNSFDCGVHLLHSFERFLKNPTRVYKKVIESVDLRLEFGFDTGGKRLLIKELIPEK